MAPKNEIFQQLRSKEFSRLDRQRQAYLDYTGSGLYSESQIQDYVELLSNNILGNPHSVNPSSIESTKRIHSVRDRIRKFFDADDYEIIFTSNATAAMKLVGESYPFDRRRSFVLTSDNHNSVNGMREFARAKGAIVTYIPLEQDLKISSIDGHIQNSPPGLFAYPAQSNFSGVKHPLSWIKSAHRFDYHVLLDAAAFVSTNPLNLGKEEPDYVPISFYKMFGFPTGVGALLARREALNQLERPWFSGGTIHYVSTTNPVHLAVKGSQGFEDGTVNFLGIMALARGFDLLESIGIDQIKEHVSQLTERLLEQLATLAHSNGKPLVRIYGPRSMKDRGSTIAFNLLDKEGMEIDSQRVAELTTANNVSVRTGCFCNPGAAEYAFGYDSQLAKACFESIPHDEFTLQDFSSCMKGKPVGAVRASLGIASNEEDIDKLILVMKQFVNTSNQDTVLSSSPPLLEARTPDSA